MIRLNGINSIYYGLSSERTGNTGWAQGDLFVETDAGGLYQFFMGEWNIWSLNIAIPENQPAQPVAYQGQIDT